LKYHSCNGRIKTTFETEDVIDGSGDTGEEGQDLGEE